MYNSDAEKILSLNRNLKTIISVYHLSYYSHYTHDHNILWSFIWTMALYCVYGLFPSCSYGPNATWLLEKKPVAQSAGAAKYTDRIPAEEQHSPNECPACDTKQSDGEVTVMLDLWGMWSTPLLPSLLGLFYPEWLHLIGSYLWVKQN